jgi:hypothetical protein
VLELPAEIVVVVDRHHAAHAWPRVQDRRGARLRQPVSRMPHRARDNAGGVAQQRAQKIEIVDRVQRQLQPLLVRHEREHGPRRQQVQMHLDIDDLAEQAACDRVLHRQHHRREA